jgi:ATP-dependent exoDNAse (exonuclease V) alpha subunit
MAAEGAHAHEVEARADAFLHRGEIVALDPVAGERCYTTRELLLIERELVDGAIQRRGSGVGLAEEAAVDGAIDPRPNLNYEQRELVRALTSSGDGVQVVRAAAGTGKTFALDAARQAWQNSGVPVLGCALSARAACELHDQAGVDAVTIARLRHALGRGIELARGSVLIVDEAGMVGTRDLAALAGRRATRAGEARARRRRSTASEIDAGGAFRALLNAWEPSSCARSIANASPGTATRSMHCEVATSSASQTPTTPTVASSRRPPLTPSATRSQATGGMLTTQASGR